MLEMDAKQNKLMQLTQYPDEKMRFLLLLNQSEWKLLWERRVWNTLAHIHTLVRSS